MEDLTTPDTFADPMQFDLERAKLARRRKIAEQLLAQPIEPIPGQMISGRYVAPNPGQYFNQAMQKVFAARDSNRLDEEEAALAKREAEMSNRMLSSIPAEAGPERLQAQVQAMRFPSLREAIKAQLMGDEAMAKRIEAGEQAAANRSLREQEMIDRGEQRAADRVAREELRRMPTIHISTGGGGGAAGDGKPLTSQQEKAALELGSEFATVNRLASTFKDEYSGDIRSSIQRQFGKMAGGAAPQATQEMTRWWSDQAMMDELPQRHALFGAALTANEQRSWNDAAINPSLSPDVIRKRLAVRQEIMANAAERMRASAVAGGKSGKQFDAATGGLKPARSGASGSWGEAKPTVVRTGTRNGVRVEQLSDGTIREVK